VRHQITLSDGRDLRHSKVGSGLEDQDWREVKATYKSSNGINTATAATVVK